MVIAFCEFGLNSIDVFSDFFLHRTQLYFLRPLPIRRLVLQLWMEKGNAPYATFSAGKDENILKCTLQDQTLLDAWIRTIRWPLHRHEIFLELVFPDESAIRQPLLSSLHASNLMQ
jgi:hypothetical protein